MAKSKSSSTTAKSSAGAKKAAPARSTAPKRTTATTAKKTTTARKPTAAKKAAAPKKAAAARKPAAAKKAPAPKKPRKTAPRKAKAAAKQPDDNLESMSPAAQDAYMLSEAAVRLDAARGNGANRDVKKLASALENEMEVWTAIRTAATRWTEDDRQATRQNLCRLADFVSGTIMSAGVDISDSTLNTLININLQIAEGLLEGETQQKIRDEAYRLWEDEGCQHGKDQEYWYRAEENVRRQT